MQTKRCTISWSHATVLIWASIWMLAVPLFHVHPEADHRHGETGHVHGGTVHTVLSRDLDCEFDRQQEVDRTGKATSAEVLLSARHSHPWSGHLQFEFSLLNDSTDRKSVKPLLIQVICDAFAVTSDPERRDWIEQNTTCSPSVVLFIHDIPSRAPPALLV